MTCGESDILCERISARTSSTNGVCLSVVFSSSSRFTAEEEVDLEAPLTAMGIKNIFSQSKADFRHLSEWQLSVMHSTVFMSSSCVHMFVLELMISLVVDCELQPHESRLSVECENESLVTIQRQMISKQTILLKAFVYYHNSCC